MPTKEKQGDTTVVEPIVGRAAGLVTDNPQSSPLSDPEPPKSKKAPPLPAEFPKGLEVVGVSNGQAISDGITYALDANIHYVAESGLVDGKRVEAGFHYQPPVVRHSGMLNDEGLLNQHEPRTVAATYRNDWHKPGLPLVRAMPGFRIVRDMRLQQNILMREMDNLDKL